MLDLVLRRRNVREESATCQQCSKEPRGPWADVVKKPLSPRVRCVFFRCALWGAWEVLRTASRHVGDGGSQLSRQNRTRDALSCRVRS